MFHQNALQSYTACLQLSLSLQADELHARVTCQDVLDAEADCSAQVARLRGVCGRVTRF